MADIVVAGPRGSTRLFPVRFSTFPDSDTHCVVPDIAEISGQRILIRHDLYPDQNNKIIELFWLIDVLRDNNIRDVSVFVPYLPYARQDKHHIPGETISASTLCKLLHSLGCQRLYTIDCHFMKGARQAERGGLHIVSFSAASYLIAACRQRIGHDNFEVIGPDKGSSYLTQDFGSKHLHKTRGDYDVSASSGSYRRIISMEDGHLQFTHQTAVIMDDMISTGSTILRAIESLRRRQIRDIYVATTHGIFLGDSIDKLDTLANGVIAGDSIPNPHSIGLTEPLFREAVLPAWLAAPN